MIVKNASGFQDNERRDRQPRHSKSSKRVSRKTKIQIRSAAPGGFLCSTTM